MANTPASTCSTCPSDGLGRALIPIVDEAGRSEICWVCFLTLLTRLRASQDVTVFVARPAVTS